MHNIKWHFSASLWYVVLFNVVDYEIQALKQSSYCIFEERIIRWKFNKINCIDLMSSKKRGTDDSQCFSSDCNLTIEKQQF